MLKPKKINKFIAAIIILFLCVTAFSSCNSDPDKGRIPFFPDSFLYQFMLKPEWQVINTSDNINTLAIVHNEAGVFLITECYKKTDVADINVTDVDSFIKFYTTFESIKEIYENERNTVDEAVPLTAKEIKNTPIISGKRQKIFLITDETLTSPNHTSEFIYLETADYFFVVSYGMPNDNYTNNAKNAVNDAIFHIQIN